MCHGSTIPTPSTGLISSSVNSFIRENYTNTPDRLGTECVFFDCSKGTECALVPSLYRVLVECIGMYRIHSALSNMINVISDSDAHDAWQYKTKGNDNNDDMVKVNETKYIYFI